MSKITQLVKGTACNARCPMCLSLRSQYGEPPANGSIRHADFGDDYLQRLQRAYETALDTGSTELVITSYGDPLDNRNRPELLPDEIRLAVDCGFTQTTLISNYIKADVALLKILRDAGLTIASMSIHATTQQDYEEYLGVRYPLEQTLWKSNHADDVGLTVRHNYVWHEGLVLGDVLAQSWRYFAKQVTIIQQVLVNDFTQPVPLPVVPPLFKPVTTHNWGMQIYEIHHLGSPMTVAWCRFGQTDPGFDHQEKNLYINLLHDGSVVVREGGYFNPTEGILHEV